MRLFQKSVEESYAYRDGTITLKYFHSTVRQNLTSGWTWTIQYPNWLHEISHEVYEDYDDARKEAIAKMDEWWKS